MIIPLCPPEGGVTLATGSFGSVIVQLPTLKLSPGFSSVLSCRIMLFTYAGKLEAGSFSHNSFFFASAVSVAAKKKATKPSKNTNFNVF